MVPNIGKVTQETLSRPKTGAMVASFNQFCNYSGQNDEWGSHYHFVIIRKTREKNHELFGGWPEIWPKSAKFGQNFIVKGKFLQNLTT